jgi:hypothetical protein
MTMSVKLPSDDVGATLKRTNGVRGQRYGEIILVGSDPGTGRQVGSVYNTTGLNDPTGTGDSCPQALWDRIDVHVLTKEYNALGAVKNGPRLWCLDWVEGMSGAERDFAGLKAHWSMWLDVTDQMRQQGTSAYTPATGRRDTRFGINAGSPAFILDDPDDNSWVMKSVSLITHPEQTYEGLTGLDDRLNLPPGWAFRAIVLDADLVLTPDNGTARITQDDLGNVYDRAGGPFSNYRP